MTEPPLHDGDADRRRQLTDARVRLTRVEAQRRRLRAEIARLQAEGDDAVAERLEAELARLGEAPADAPPAPFRGVSAPDATAPANEPQPRHLRADPPELGPPKPNQKTTRRRPPPKPTSHPDTAAAEVDPSAAIDFVANTEASTPKPAGGRRRRRRRTLTAWVRERPDLSTSIGVHALMLLVLSLLSIVTLRDPPYLLLGSAPSGDDFFDEVAEFDLTPVEFDASELDDSELSLEPLDAELEAVELETALDAADGLTGFDPGLAALPVDAAGLLRGNSGGEPDAGRAASAEPGGGEEVGSTQFFGAKSRGNRFVFVVDNSGSMQSGRMETTLLELQRAVGALTSKQSFYVIFYSDQAYPMFYPEPVHEMAPATRDNKRRLGKWLETVEICLGGRLYEAMEMAAVLEPSVVYLLSDGDIRSQRTIDYLTRDNGWPFTVHTLGMTVRSAADAGKLRAIAAAHGGGFTPVGVTPIAAQMARRRPIRYNREPGPVWGTNLRATNLRGASVR